MESNIMNRMDSTKSIRVQDVKKISTEFFSITHQELMSQLRRMKPEEYEEFCNSRASRDTLRFLGLIFGLISTYWYTLALIHAKSRVIILISAVSMILVRNPLIVLLLYIKEQASKGSNSPCILLGSRLSPYATSFAAVYTCVGLGLFLIARVVNGRCDSISQLYVWGCNSEYEAQALPQDVLLALMFAPIIFSTVFKAIKQYYVMVSWIIVVLCSAIAIAVGDCVQSIPVLVLYVPVSIAVLYENYRQNIILFLISRKQQSLFDENKILAEEAQTELRFMIANMAHDLKTPLSAFVNGTEILSSLFSDLKKKDNTLQRTKELYKAINENIKNLFNVNNFMTMTVNRCIDYMKASKGIKLEPRLETINLQEVLSMPLNCMKDLQSRIALQQTPIPAGIAAHIITDLQWFQENLFCLISNAVKYSSQGHITVSVERTTLSHTLLTSAREKREALHRKSVKHSDADDELSVTSEGINHPERYTFLDKILQLSRDGTETVTIDETLNRMELGAYAAKPEASDKAAKHASRRFKKNSVYAAAPPSENLRVLEQMRPIHSGSDSPEEPETFLLIEVEDTGIGLSDEVKQSLFAPFKQAQRRAGGTGLGLYSLAKRVDALGGYYGVTNRRDGEQGSVFWFAIPYRPDFGVNSGSQPCSLRQTLEETSEKDEAICLSPTAELSASASRSDRPPAIVLTPTTVSSANSSPALGEKLKVLVVDDSLTILKMTTNLLRRQGHTVDKGENGAEALKAIETSRATGEPYDVVLMDLNMPVMDGLEAMKRLRERERLLNEAAEEGAPQVHQRVFAFSANSDRETMVEAMGAGADDFICKPFSIHTFNEKVTKFRAPDLVPDLPVGV